MTPLDPGLVLLVLAVLRLLTRAVDAVVKWLVWRTAVRTPTGADIEYRDRAGTVWKAKRGAIPHGDPR